MLKKFEPPAVSLRSYGGNRLDLVAQVPVCITRGPYQVELKVLVQKDAPNPLLLGTNALPALGLFLLEKENLTLKVVTVATNSDTVETGTETHFVKDNQSSTQVPEGGSVADQGVTPVSEGEPHLSTPAVVQGLNATRIPPGYQKMIRARVKGEISHRLSLFTPSLTEYNLHAPDGSGPD